MLSLFDLHCDTALAMLETGEGLWQNNLHVSLSQAKAFRHYVQVMALWTPYSMTDEEGWQNTVAMLSNLKADPSIGDGRADIVTSLPDAAPKQPTLLLSIEDVRILAGKAERVKELWDMGVRLLTPLWQGDTCIGGSHDTKNGLTAFGREALDRASEMGMILDISHASPASAEEMFAISRQHQRPLIASHSNAYAVCPVSRNLSDSQIREIVRTGGLIGINLCTGFLKTEGEITAMDALPHIEHILSLGGENVLALGGDMDGCQLPPDIQGLGEWPRLAEYMAAHNYPQALIDRIFFANAHRFAKRYLI